MTAHLRLVYACSAVLLAGPASRGEEPAPPDAATTAIFGTRPAASPPAPARDDPGRKPAADASLTAQVEAMEKQIATLELRLGKPLQAPTAYNSLEKRVEDLKRRIDRLENELNEKMRRMEERIRALEQKAATKGK